MNSEEQKASAERVNKLRREFDERYKRSQSIDPDKLHFFYGLAFFVAIIAMIVILLCMYGCGGSGGEQDNSNNAERVIRYIVTGSVINSDERPVISLWYINNTGGYTTIDEFMVPWEYKFNARVGDHATCMAQYHGNSKIKITTQLYQDGKLIDEMYSIGDIAVIAYVDKIVE